MTTTKKTANTAEELRVPTTQWEQFTAWVLGPHDHISMWGPFADIMLGGDITDEDYTTESYGWDMNALDTEFANSDANPFRWLTSEKALYELGPDMNAREAMDLSHPLLPGRFMRWFLEHVPTEVALRVLRNGAAADWSPEQRALAFPQHQDESVRDLHTALFGTKDTV